MCRAKSEEIPRAWHGGRAVFEMDIMLYYIILYTASPRRGRIIYRSMDGGKVTE